MESRDQTEKLTGGIPPDRQLAEPESGIVARIIDETRGLSTDLTSLVELRIKKAQLDIEERIDRKVNEVTTNLIFAVLAGLGGLFLLVALSLGIGALLGHPGWGFLIVGILLALTGFITKKAQPELVNRGTKKAVIEQKKLAPGGPQGQPHIQTDGR